MTWKFPATIIAYAVALVAIGYTGMTVAPPGANPATALLVPLIFALAMVACLVLAFLINANRTLGMIGIHAAIILPLIAAAGSFSRLGGSVDSAQQFNAQLEQIQTTIKRDADRGSRIVHLSIAPPDRIAADQTANAVREDAPRVLKARTADGELLFESDARADWRPKAYQSVSLLAVAVLSLFAFVALVAQRPKLPPKQDKSSLKKAPDDA